MILTIILASGFHILCRIIEGGFSLLVCDLRLGSRGRMVLPESQYWFVLAARLFLAIVDPVLSVVHRGVTKVRRRQMQTAFPNFGIPRYRRPGRGSSTTAGPSNVRYTRLTVETVPLSPPWLLLRHVCCCWCWGRVRPFPLSDGKRYWHSVGYRQLSRTTRGVEDVQLVNKDIRSTREGDGGSPRLFVAVPKQNITQ